MFLIFIALIVWVFFISLTKPNTIVNNNHNARAILLIFICFIGYAFIKLDTDTITDMSVYISDLQSYSSISLTQALDISNKEFLFTVYQWSLAQISVSPTIFKLSVWFGFSLIFIVALRNIFSPWQLLMVFLSYITFFIFFDYVANVIRQGIAVSLLLFAISTFAIPKKQSKLFYLAIIFAPLFHVSALPLSIALLLFRKISLKLRYFVAIWCISVFLFLTNLNRALFGSPNIDLMNNYTSESVYNQYGSAGNRIDFLLFSAIWVILGIVIIKYFKYNTESYQLIFKFYLIFNTYYLLLGFVAFSDRLAAYSWFLIPILVLYPVLKTSRYKPLLAFTCLLVFLITGAYTGSFSILINN